MRYTHPAVGSLRVPTMKGNPYRPEILGTFLLSAFVLPVETWRRWGELLSPAALDDPLIFGSAMVVATQLARRNPAAPLRWVFVCGGAWFLMCLSTWGTIYGFEDGDPSGAPVLLVVGLKLIGLMLASVASWRAIQAQRSGAPFGDRA